MRSSELPERLANLIADFERSQLGELRLTGSGFELCLRKGRKPRWTTAGESEPVAR